VDVVVNSRNCEVSDRFRQLLDEKLAKLEKYDSRIIRVDVEVTKEHNPRLADSSTRVQITIRSKGPVVRAEEAAGDKVSALDKAVERLSSQLRKAADRRRVHHGMRTPPPLAQVLEGQAVVQEPLQNDGLASEHKVGPLTVVGDGPLVVREKTHPASPMTLDQALYEMELVGHDFYLFLDKEHADQPAVVYRRRGYDYGVIRLSSASQEP
jgi:ribosomal subunit interface protein